jgi:hypothetical protein
VEDRFMRIARSILALFVAVALAMLPAAGHVSVAAASADPAMTDMSAMHHGVAMHHHEASVDEVADCCPHKHDGSHNAVDDCATMAGCILCVGFLASAPAELVSPVLLTSATIPFASAPLHSQTGSPPFRPPRG